MEHRRLLFYSLALISSLTGGCRKCPDYLPRTPKASDRVIYMDLAPLCPSDRLTVVSLQGLANRDHAEIFTYAILYRMAPGD